MLNVDIYPRDVPLMDFLKETTPKLTIEHVEENAMYWIFEYCIAATAAAYCARSAKMVPNGLIH